MSYRLVADPEANPVASPRNKVAVHARFGEDKPLVEHGFPVVFEHQLLRQLPPERNLI